MSAQDIILWDGNNVDEVKSFLGNLFITTIFEKCIGGKRMMRFKSGNTPVNIESDNYIFKGQSGDCYIISKKDINVVVIKH